MPPELVFVLPTYDPRSPTHMAHVGRLAEELATRVGVRLVTHRSSNVPSQLAPGLSVDIVDTRSWTVGMYEMTRALLRAWNDGCHTAYVHYSYYGAISAGLLRRFLPRLKVYYWNCGEHWWYLRPLRPDVGVLRHKARSEWPLRASIRLADMLVTGSPRMADGYARWFGMPRDRIAVIPNFIDLSVWTPSQEAGASDQRRVLFVHRLSSRKGASVLPGILARIAREVKGASFTVIGDGPDRRAVVERCVEAGLDVRFLGWVPNSELLHHYRHSDLLLMPSLEEGFPRVLLEAMATGCPFVATAVGAVPDLVSTAQTISVIPPDDWACFGDRAVALLNAPEQRRGLGAAGLERVVRFDLQRVVNDYVALIQGREISSW